ncbi:TPA: hypothetical protein L7182_002685 [Klebsiella pneumoniae]|nr:hypothetical protein [Klebsiella pneumoniae]HDS9271372.1 hypothetical protein [Klebsiella pneumoniae subsp. pneumoniae]QAX16240.1 hypothetical protein C2M13_15240 [Klebsiella pneumoniae]TYW66736.1 hypothetical protein FCG65_013235 [Klebsiella pneumoniae]HBQ4442395.1 hypothetical protein [Klebsiella pneumoniae]
MIVSIYSCANLCANVNDGDRDVESDNFDDPLFDQAISFVIEKRNASVAGLQRQFRIGYSRASRLVEQMEEIGVVSTQGSDGNRDVLASSQFDIAALNLKALREEKEGRRQEELSRQAKIANSVDEQLRLSAITNKRIVIWLKDTGNVAPSGNKVFILKSSSPFEYLAKQQKNKLKPGDAEYSDILDGYRFSATMQMRTPTSVLCQHGRIEKVPAHKLPRIVKQDWQGIWLPHLKPAAELGAWARDVNGSMASDVGYVPQDGGDFLRFLLLAHQIVEDDISDEERVRWLESCYHMVGSDGEAIGSFMERYGDRADVALRAITNSVKKG